LSQQRTLLSLGVVVVVRVMVLAAAALVVG